MRRESRRATRVAIEDERSSLDVTSIIEFVQKHLACSTAVGSGSLEPFRNLSLLCLTTALAAALA
jgi:hypothetical protein